jgi:MYXO-CTERM domain-containing protein
MHVRSRHAAWLLSAISSLALATSAIASPITLSFTGVVVNFVVGVSNTQVPENIGLPFTGSVTYDLANAEDTTTVDVPGLAQNLATSGSGCFVARDGVCTADSGPNPPIITDWHVNGGGVDGITPHTDTLGSGISSFLTAVRLGPSQANPFGLDQFNIQQQYVMSRVDSATQLVESYQTLFELTLVGDNGLLSAVDLLHTPLLSNANQLAQVSVVSTHSVCGVATCISSDRTLMSGRLSTLTVGNDAALPEPEESALLAAAAFAAATVGRRRRTGSTVAN